MWKTREILYPSLTAQAQHATCACYVVKKTWRRETLIVAARMAFFRLQREPNLKSGHILVIIRMLRDSWSRTAALSAGAARRKLLWRAATHPIYATSPSTVQRMQGKLTLSLGAWCMCMSSFVWFAVVINLNWPDSGTTEQSLSVIWQVIIPQILMQSCSKSNIRNI